jgi:hypothetical protein
LPAGGGKGQIHLFQLSRIDSVECERWRSEDFVLLVHAPSTMSRISASIPEPVTEATMQRLRIQMSAIVFGAIGVQCKHG